NQLVCADFQNGRKKPPAVAVVAGDAESLGHVATSKLHENDTRAIAVEPPEDLDPLLQEGHLVFDLNVQPLLYPEPQRARQIERHRAGLEGAPRVDLSGALQIIEFRRHSRGCLIENAVSVDLLQIG